MNGIYLDHAATTNVLGTVYRSMAQYAKTCLGNPSAIHSAGKNARQTIDLARDDVLKMIGAPECGRLIFTSGGSEANNLALTGMVHHLLDVQRQKILIGATEHASIMNQRARLRIRGIDSELIEVEKSGVVMLEKLEDLLRNNCVGLVSVMMVNNETGTVQPISQISELCHRYGALVHTDGVQAVGHIPINVNDLGVDLMSISGHKFGAPDGIGALYVNGPEVLSILEPLLLGGSQEYGIRAGTENVIGIVGLGAAARYVNSDLVFDIEIYKALRCEFIKVLRDSGEEFKVNGYSLMTGCCPNILSITFGDVEAEALLLLMNYDGVYISAASACSAGSL